MTFDQINALLGSLMPEGASDVAPHELRPDVAIHDPRQHIPGMAHPTKLSLEYILTLPAAEQPEAFKALGIENRRVKAETEKAKRFTALRSGQGDPKMIAPPGKFLSKGYRGMTRQKNKPYYTQPVVNGGMTKPKSRSEQLADLYGSYIDKPNDPSTQGSLNSDVFEKEFGKIAPPRSGYTTADIGTLQQNPNYRGIRLVLPQSGFTYQDGVRSAGQALARQGFPRIMTEGPPGLPIAGDPHYNNIPQYPHNEPPDHGGLREEVYGHLITRGYPVYGGTGDFGGEFPPGFNPVGFGQRDEVGAKALIPRR